MTHFLGFALEESVPEFWIVFGGGVELGVDWNRDCGVGAPSWFVLIPGVDVGCGLWVLAVGVVGFVTVVVFCNINKIGRVGRVGYRVGRVGLGGINKHKKT